MPRPSPKKLAQQVAAFNKQFSIGDEVAYFEVVGMGEPKHYRTRTAAEVLSGHTAVVWLDGKSGCVCCSHCFPVNAPAGVPVKDGGTNG